MMVESLTHNDRVEKLLSGILEELKIANKIKEKEMLVNHHGKYPHLEYWDVERIREGIHFENYWEANGLGSNYDGLRLKGDKANGQ